MNNALTITQDGRPLPPSIIGFNVGGRVIGIRDVGLVTWNGILKAGAATGIAAAATAVRGAHLAIAEIETTRGQLKATVAVLQQRNSDLATALIAAEAKAGKKPARWSAAECALLLELRATGMAYGKIAEALGTGRTAGAVGAKARALAAPKAKTVRKARK